MNKLASLEIVMPGNYERKDHFYEKAKSEGYRSRAAYKLLELDKKFKLLKPDSKVLDLGCFPGGWLQIASEKVGQNGLVVGIDLVEVEPISVKGRIRKAPLILQGDIFDPQMQAKLQEAVAETPFVPGHYDVVLSDMSPKLSGIRFRDSVKSAELVEAGLMVCEQMLKTDGAFIAKIFPGAESDALLQQMKKRFRNFSRHGLDSSRKTSTEFYFVARGFSR